MRMKVCNLANCSYGSGRVGSAKSDPCPTLDSRHYKTKPYKPICDKAIRHYDRQAVRDIFSVKANATRPTGRRLASAVQTAASDSVPAADIT